MPPPKYKVTGCARFFFFLIIFVIEKNPSGDFRLLLIKVGLLASASSFIYNLLLETDPDPEVVD